LLASGVISMNLNTWKKLPPDLQQAITDAMVYSEKITAY
jgi:TRAP-type C4-dicarboxylate transport system substrate-binding protein